MKRIALLLALLVLLSTWCVVRADDAPSLYERADGLTPDTPIDKAVLSQLNRLKIQPARLCSDAVFLRRVYLDVIGTLPTSAEAVTFLTDKSADKRARLIDALLERSEFADYWAMKWSDMLRVKAEFPINLWPGASMAYYRYIHDSIRTNMPYDRFVRQLLTSSGSNFRVAPVNFYRAMQSNDPASLARAAALAFMGQRAETWPVERLEGMAALFAYVGYKPTREWKEEIVYFDAIRAATDQAAGKMPRGVLPDGTPVTLSAEVDPRTVFADWLIDAKNPHFARCAANRAWYWLMGRGIVHEADDFRPDNPPTNPELLDLLARELVDSKYDMKHLFRTILNSKTYQLAPVPRSKHPLAEANFAFYSLRQLDAEVLIDALCQISGTTEEYSSQIPEPFTWVPRSHRTIALPDGSITSPFLEMFGRPSRDTGVLSERNNRPSAAQRLHMLNSSHVRKKIEQSPIVKKMTTVGRRDMRRAVTGMYLTLLSRFPTDKELDAVTAYSASGEARGTRALVDLAWALINSSEFMCRH